MIAIVADMVTEADFMDLDSTEADFMVVDFMEADFMEADFMVLDPIIPDTTEAIITGMDLDTSSDKQLN